MAFQAIQPVQIITCPSCSGKGCPECGNFGVYGLAGDKTLVFNLPAFLNLEKRRKARLLFLLKRLVLLVIFLLFITVVWSLII